MDEIVFLPSCLNLPGANIKVVGVGGAGCNGVDRMIESGVGGVQFIAMNTDQQSLAQSKAHVKIPLGPGCSRGLGAGGNAERGAVAAEESRDEILASLQGADMVFITAGMGGGTGTGASPVVASCARELGALTVAVVLTPFRYEGAGKALKAEAGLDNLRNTADTVIVVSNEKLLAHCERGIKVKEAYRVADGVLIQGVRGITDLILRPGTLNGDFADVENVLRTGREALIGTGVGRGDDAIQDALRRALDCPLLERSTWGPATQVIVSVMADWDRVELSAVDDAMTYLSEHYQGLADIKLCQVEAPELEERAMVTVLASGFDLGTQASQNLAPVASMASMASVVPVAQETMADSRQVYGEAVAEAAFTPTRLMPQAPTPSAELGNSRELGPNGEDLHVPAIIRQNNRLPGLEG